MTYFGQFNFWLLFLNLKLICPGIRKNHETYVAGGGGTANFYFFRNSPRPNMKSIDPHTPGRFLKTPGNVWTPYYIYI